MAGHWTHTTHIDRPIEEVFAFLADGENDRKWSPVRNELVGGEVVSTGVCDWRRTAASIARVLVESLMTSVKRDVLTRGSGCPQRCNGRELDTDPIVWEQPPKLKSTSVKARGSLKEPAGQSDPGANGGQDPPA